MKFSMIFIFICCCASSSFAQRADKDSYLADLTREMSQMWPENRTINLVFHGHSVPAGYWNDHRVETLASYPNLVLKKLKAKYPYAVINVIITAIGGENAVQGAARFDRDVLSMKPDVLFIDYSLNDQGGGLVKAEMAWRAMIEAAKKAGIKVILLTPSMDQRVDLLQEENVLAMHAKQVRGLADEYEIGLADSYAAFIGKLKETGSIKAYMSSVNHPNSAGHALIAAEIGKWF